MVTISHPTNIYFPGGRPAGFSARAGGTYLGSARFVLDADVIADSSWLQTIEMISQLIMMLSILARLDVGSHRRIRFKYAFLNLFVFTDV